MIHIQRLRLNLFRRSPSQHRLRRTVAINIDRRYNLGTTWPIGRPRSIGLRRWCLDNLIRRRTHRLGNPCPLLTPDSCPLTPRNWRRFVDNCLPDSCLLSPDSCPLPLSYRPRWLRRRAANFRRRLCRRLRRKRIIQERIAEHRHRRAATYCPAAHSTAATKAVAATSA